VLCDEPMKTDLSRAEASQNGDMPVLETASNVPESVRGPSVSAAEQKAAQIRDAAERELKAARDEAARLRGQARNRAAEMKTEALRERIEYRAAAEKQIARLRAEAEAEADEIRAGATAEVENARADAEAEASERLARAETAITAMIEDAHRLAAQIVDAAQLEADQIIADAGNKIGVLDETAREITATIAEMKERFETATEPAAIEEPVSAGGIEGMVAVVETGDAVAVHEEEIVAIEPTTEDRSFEIEDPADAEILAFVAEQASPPRRRWFQIFRRA
jgi:vacuolar-type H+-ATPase subunit H